MTKKPVKPKDSNKELAEVKALAARYAVADPGKDVIQAFLRRVAAL